MNNPLMFSSQVNQSLTQLLQEALVKLSCPSDKLNDFDHFSTILIELDGLPDVRVSLNNDRLWIWSLFEQLDEKALLLQASSVFRLLQEPVEFIELNQLMLGKVDKDYVLKALVTPASLNTENALSVVIQKFYEILKSFCSLLEIKKSTGKSPSYL